MTATAILAKAQEVAQRFAEGNMISTVDVTRPADPVFDSTTGLLSEASSEVYSGKARITPITGPIEQSTGDIPTFFQSCYVSVPLGAPVPRVDDVVTITAHLDPAAVGRAFRVTDVASGGEIPVVRRLACTGIEHTRSGDYT